MQNRQQIGCVMFFLIFGVVALIATQFGCGPSDADAATATKRCARVQDPTPATVTAKGVTCKTARPVVRDALRGGQGGDRRFEIYPQRRSWTCTVRSSGTIVCGRYSHRVTVRPV